MKEVRKLAPHAAGMGLDGEAVLRRTFTRMSGLPRFEALFLRGALARSFLSVNESPPRGARPSTGERAEQALSKLTGGECLPSGHFSEESNDA